MANLVAGLVAGVLKKLATERFVSRVLVLLMKTISKSTENTLDDEACKAIGDALGNPCD